MVLSNNISSDELPTLQSPSDRIFWGNENASVSTAMLISIAVTLGIKTDHMDMPAAATVYPFRNREFQLPSDLVPTAYPFTSQCTMCLLGDYHYGGQRSWYQEPSFNTDRTNQLLLGPEDSSSAVGKATYCTTEQANNLNTNEIIKSYDHLNNSYDYSPITCLQGNVTDQQLRSIHPGNIYVFTGHTAIIASKPDYKGNIITLRFSRNIDLSTQYKKSGGGLYGYNLGTEAKEKTIYILSKEMPWKKSANLTDFIRKIQAKYETIFPNRAVNTFGDCRIFYE